MEKHFKTLLAALATVSGASTEELTAKLLSDDADTADIASELAAVLTTHKEKVKAQKATDNSDGYKKAQREVLNKLEGEAKTKYGVSTDKTGLDLIDEIVAAKAGSPENIAEDVVKRSAAYLSLEKSISDKVSEATKAADQKLTDLQTSYTRREQFDTVKGKALAEFDKLNPVLPADAGAAAKRRERFVKDLEQGTNFELTQAGDVLLLDAAGKRREDAHGNPVKFSDHVKAIADDLGFEYKVASDRNSPGNDGSKNPASNDSKYKGALPKTEAEYIGLLTNSTLSTDEKVEVQGYWAEQQKAA